MRSESPSEAVVASPALSSIFLTAAGSALSGSINGISMRSNPAALVLSMACFSPASSNSPVHTEAWHPICMWVLLRSGDG